MQSVWDKKKTTILKTAGLVVMASLVLGNIWLADKVVKGDTSGLALSPLEVKKVLFDETSAVRWTEPRNILVLGRAGEGNNAPYLTDTIFVLHTDTTNNKLKLVSLPRDLLVRLDDEKVLKLNAVWLYTSGGQKNDFSALNKEIEEITGLGIDYTVVFDLATLEQVIDKVDGVVVHVPEDIYDPRFPTESGGYQTYSRASGGRPLTSKEALRFVRPRHSPGGDFERIARQQEL